MYLIPCSAGEVLDKLSVLQIKIDRIRDSQKLTHVQNEREAILAVVPPAVLSQCAALYSMLVRVNGRIWDMCDETRYADLLRKPDPNVVMTENDARFRLKKKIDRQIGSFVHEQKNFDNNNVSVFIPKGDGNSNTKDVVARLRFLSVHHDSVQVMIEDCQWGDTLLDSMTDDPSIRRVYDCPPKESWDDYLDLHGFHLSGRYAEFCLKMGFQEWMDWWMSQM
jgi:hypothetical protein